MIINTGMRTDIPAFYSKWFINRIRDGYVLVRNPYRPEWITRYRLAPDVVDCIAFCTKNPAPMLAYMDELKQFGQFWFVTITPYGRDIEPNVPPKEQVMQDLISLSKKIGLDRVVWRYDPIFIDDKYTIAEHSKFFEEMCRTLAGYINVCVISFIDLYEKVKHNFPQVKEVTKQEEIRIAESFVKIGKKYGIKIKGCAERAELVQYGVDCAGCMTKDVFEKAIDNYLSVPKAKPARPACACVSGSDIGAYDTCGHFCRYCYANSNINNVKRNIAEHDPTSPLIVGKVGEGEVIHQAEQESWIDRQLRLF